MFSTGKKGRSQWNNGAASSVNNWPRPDPGEENLWEEDFLAKPGLKDYMLHLRIWKIILTNMLVL